MKAFTIYEDEYFIESLILGKIAVTLIDQLKGNTSVTLRATPVQLVT